jgi:hypothetical protein
MPQSITRAEGTLASASVMVICCRNRNMVVSLYCAASAVITQVK